MAETITAPKAAEGSPAKARRYLLEGRLRVAAISSNAISATCRGDGETYKVGYVEHSWYCTCPARTDQCAHLRALRLVVDAPST